MELTILAASGATGLELTRQALARGHTVIAIARTPSRIIVPDWSQSRVDRQHDINMKTGNVDVNIDAVNMGLNDVDAVETRLTRVAADVRDQGSIAAALAGRQVVLSGLGIADGDQPGALTAGARAVVAARPARIVWLGAYGTGPSAQAAGVATRTLLKMMGDKLADKVAADAAVLAAGGTVFHAGPLSNGPLSATRRTVGLGLAPKRFFPARVSRATVATAMLDEAENPAYLGAVAVPLERQAAMAAAVRKSGSSAGRP